MTFVIGIAVFSYVDGVAIRNAIAGAEKSRVAVEQTHELLSRLTDAETGQRGYLLTGDRG
jgi:CHASE3 domain sensor protein